MNAISLTQRRISCLHSQSVCRTDTRSDNWDVTETKEVYSSSAICTFTDLTQRPVSFFFPASRLLSLRCLTTSLASLYRRPPDTGCMAADHSLKCPGSRLGQSLNISTQTYGNSFVVYFNPLSVFTACSVSKICHYYTPALYRNWIQKLHEHACHKDMHVRFIGCRCAQLSLSNRLVTCPWWTPLLVP